LNTLAQIARTNRSSIITPTVFQQAFEMYTQTNYKEGVPYTAESHYPYENTWSADTSNHSEHYLHSTYIDNLFANLLGIIPTLDDRLEVRPLIPSSWTYFAIESLPYHGFLLSIMWDQFGGRYINNPQGLTVYLNGERVHNQATLAPLNITLPRKDDAVKSLASLPRYDNIFANPDSPHGLPSIEAGYTFNDYGSQSQQAWKLNDGLLWYDSVPDNRWTSNQTSAPVNKLTITLPRPRTFGSVSLAVFDDSDRGGVIRCPNAIKILSHDNNILAFREPFNCIPNALNTIVFDGGEVTTHSIVVILSNAVYYAVGLAEIQIWVPRQTGPRWEAEDGLPGTRVGGKGYGTNASLSEDGVELGQGGWVELAGVQRQSGVAGSGTITIAGKGPGSVIVQMNWLSNSTVIVFGSRGKEQIIQVDFLAGENTVTIFQISGKPWIDAIVVE